LKNLKNFRVSESCAQIVEKSVIYEDIIYLISFLAFILYIYYKINFPNYSQLLNPIHMLVYLLHIMYNKLIVYR